MNSLHKEPSATSVPTTSSDPWLSALLWFNDYFGLARHRGQILAGLPLEQGRLNAQLLPRAAAQTGLAAQAITIDVRTLSQLPMLATGIDGQPFIIQGSHGNTLSGFYAEDVGTPVNLPMEQLQSTGWWLCPLETTDTRADDLHAKPQTHWLKAAIASMRPWYRDMLLASLAINIIALLIPLYTMNVYDRVVPNQAFSSLWTLSIGVVIAVVFDWLLRHARSRITDIAGRQVDVSISSDLFSKVLGMQLEKRPQSVASFAKQIQEFDSVRDFMTSATLLALVDLPFTLIFLVIMAWLGGLLVLVPIFIMLILIVVAIRAQRKMKVALEESSRHSTQRQALLIEHLLLLADTKQYNGESRAQRRWEQTIGSLADWGIASREASNSLSHTIGNAQNLLSVGLVVPGVYMIAAGQLSMGALIAIVMLAGRAGSSMSQIALLLLRYQQTQTAIVGLEQVMALPQEQSQQRQIQQANFTGAIRLEQAAFVYEGSKHPAIVAMDLQINAGERIGVIGNVGSGKSTLLALLAGQMRPTSGRLLFDGVESSLWPPSSIREHSGWVSQQPNLFFGSILDNLCYGMNSLDTSRLPAVLQASGIERFLPQLENGLESQVGELGRNLSGGQRQAIALGRALLRSPRLMLLDEPTSAMDQDAENLVLRHLQDLPATTTLLIATHRPALLALCSRVLVMDQGRLVADLPAADALQRFGMVATPKPAMARVSRVTILPTAPEATP